MASLVVHGVFYEGGSRTPVPTNGQAFPLHDRFHSANSYITYHQAGIMYFLLGAAFLSGMFGFLLSNLDGNRGASLSPRDADDGRLDRS
jgi:hypothetical protein